VLSDYDRELDVADDTIRQQQQEIERLQTAISNKHSRVVAQEAELALRADEIEQLREGCTVALAEIISLQKHYCDALGIAQSINLIAIFLEELLGEKSAGGE